MGMGSSLYLLNSSVYLRTEYTPLVLFCCVCGLLQFWVFDEICDTDTSLLGVQFQLFYNVGCLNLLLNKGT
ncbi:hypothetical protein Hanom_Chr13g01240891 [Helianthus anomalus]